MTVLENGATIGVIGGGPAGSFFCHFANKYARRNGIELNILLFDGKDFQSKGPPGCNMCAGVISTSLKKTLYKEGLLLPENRIQNRIKGYYFQSETHGVYLKQPEEEAICTVFRGNGPRGSFADDNISFDDFLLRSVLQKGVRIIHENVVDIKLRENEKECASVTTANGNTCDLDLVVGAFGLHSIPLTAIAKLNFGFVPPRSVRALQAEIKLGREFIQEHFGETIHAYSLNLGWIDFIGVIPKRDYITVSIIGRKNVTRSHLDDFLNHPVFAGKISDLSGNVEISCICHPRVVTHQARRPYHDRLVLIGDSSFSRYYKNGIESAFLTAERAAFVALNWGVSKEIFHRAYGNWAQNSIVRDNYYGKPFFYINQIINHSKFLSEVHMSTALSGRTPKAGKQIKEILWILLTGDKTYEIAFRKLFSLNLHIGLFYQSLRTGVDKMIPYLKRKRAPENLRMSIRSTSIPLRVAIVGGGPAGASCALRMKKLSRSMGRAVQIYLFEGKEFEKEPQYNQCVGILSPPIRGILENDLGIPFPDHLIQKTITGYILHSGIAQMELPEQDEKTYAVQRVTFDHYMLNQVQKQGVTIIKSRVTDIEIANGGATIYAENRNIKVDVIVGAFGLDDGGCRLFERSTPYKQPNFLESVITKIHPGQAFMESFGDRIHAFLDDDVNIEFGAMSPKQNHITINIAGKSVRYKNMVQFLEQAEVKKLLPSEFDYRKSGLYFYKGRFPVGPARNFFGDRYVIVGDAAGLVRTFKGKGVNSGCLTGIGAADTILTNGIDREAFHQYEKHCSEILDDFKYGLGFRRLTLFSKNHHILPHIINIAKRDSPLSTAFFDAVSGNKFYKEILSDIVRFRNIKEIGKSTISYLAGYSRKDVF